MNLSREKLMSFNLKDLTIFHFDIDETIKLEGNQEDEVMIAASEPREFVPFGRSISSRHPGQDGLPQHDSKGVDLDVPLDGFRNVSIKDVPATEKWQIRECTKSEDCEEELYVKDRVVVWSRGCAYPTSTVQKSYTLQQPILQAEWSCFKVQRHKDDSTTTTEINEEVPGISITHPNSITVFTEKGEEFVAPLPFQVSKTWDIDGGLLLEQATSQTEFTSPTCKRDQEKLPTLFSLLHPLDEPSPVLSRNASSGSSKVSFVTDSMQQIVFTSRKPSLVLTFDRSIGLHSVWALRPVKKEEANTATKLLDMLGGSLSIHSATTPKHSGCSSSSLLAGLSMSAQSRLSMSNVSPAGMSPGQFRSYGSRVASPMIASRQQSPAPSFIGLSRSYSPAQSIPFSSSPGRTPQTPFGWTPGTSTMTTTACEDVGEPLTPELCLEHCWTETLSMQKDGVLGQASKAFLTSDLCGQDYLCFLLPRRRQLKCLKFRSSNDDSQLIFGGLTVLPAKDAIQLESLDMLLVLDASGALILYTGVVKVSNVVVSGIAPTIMTSSMGHSGIMPRPSTPLDSPFLTSSRPPSVSHSLADEVVLLSPVPGEAGHKLQESTCSEDLTLSHSATSSRRLARLQDPVKNKFTVVLSDGTMIRTSLPRISVSTTVQLCLEAVRFALHRDAAIQFQAKWYATHNAPGNLHGQSELMNFATCLLSLMGYDTGHLNLFMQESESSGSPVVAAKKHKTSGFDEDWDYLISSEYHRKINDTLPRFQGPSQTLKQREALDTTKPKTIDNSALLFAHIPAVTFVLHLVYEELKLNKHLMQDTKELAAVLCHLANDLQWSHYVDYYVRHHPNLLTAPRESPLTPDLKKELQYPAYFCPEPPSIHSYLYNYIVGIQQHPYPHMAGICKRTSQVISLYSLCMTEGIPEMPEMTRLSKRQSISGFPTDPFDDNLNNFLLRYPDLPPPQRTVLFMSRIGFTPATLESLPPGVALPLMEAISQCQEAPPSGWPQGAYDLLGREDLSSQVKWLSKKQHRAKGLRSSGSRAANTMGAKQDDRDGMEHLNQELLRLRFPDDLRVQEVRRLLQSSKPVTIALTQKPETSDHEFIEEQELHLLMVSQRTMALPVGRGMFTLCTSNAVVTETLHIPKLNLTGKAPPRNNTISFLNIDVPTNMNGWPLFHNGVAAGLKIARGDNQIDSAWIVYNCPQTTELTNEHAGFLMALGLNGHLSNLNRLNIHNYLCAGHEMTSVGLLLGLAAAKRGTMDVATTKILCIHISSLLPPTSTELDVPHSVQVAAILGTGLVYQKTAHRHVAEVLLGEIGRPPGPELNNCSNRESYSLAAGLALGMVTLGHGSGAVGLSDLNIPDQLYHYMAGGHKKQVSGSSREQFKSPCYQIREGDQVNLDVTSPGATLALGLMFLQTGNRAVADWLAAPDTQSLLDMVKPDFLLLRTLSRGLVLWNDIRPTEDWIESNIPSIVKTHAFKWNTEQGSTEGDIDYQTMSQAVCNIGAGACFALGLRFAGTANSSAYNCLHTYLKKLMGLASRPEAELAGKTTFKSCLYTILLALAMVMAGTGNLEVLRIARFLRGRIHNEISYGNHMACSMAIGLLFLGGGRYTLSTSQAAVAALITSLFPCFPGNSKGNRYHLQALRHLYVLAAEPRLVLPKDVDTGKPCYVPLEVVFKSSDWYEETTVKLMAPCIIGELSSLKSVRVLGPRYLGVTLDMERDMDTLKAILASGGTLFVKQRAGHLSYVEDPKGYRSLLAQILTHDTTSQQSSDLKLLESFTSDLRILNFAKQFCWQDSIKQPQENGKAQMLASLLYECVTNEKLSVLPILLILHEALDQPLDSLSAVDLWQIKLVLAYYQHHFINKTPVDETRVPARRRLIHAEACAHFKSKLDSTLDTWLKSHSTDVCNYLQSGILPPSERDCAGLFVFLQLYDIPSATKTSQTPLQGCSTLPEVYLALKDYNLPVPALLRISQCLQTSR